MPPYTPSQLKALLKEQDIRIKKRLGQNFLVDKKYLKQIINSCNVTREDSVLEIGPGLGALTEDLSLICERLITVEFDKKLCAILKKRFSDCKNVEVVCADILNYKLPLGILETPRRKTPSECEGQTKLKVIGNLPYYITSPIIVYLVNNRKYIESAFITIQKEVAERLISHPGTKTYGSLSCFVQFYCNVKIMAYIPKEAFYPQPEVKSALVRLQFLKRPPVKVEDESLFFKIIKAAFNKRRKTILNALLTSNIFDVDKEQLNKILLNLKINPNRRGETLSLEEFARLAREIGRFMNPVPF